MSRMIWKWTLAPVRILAWAFLVAAAPHAVFAQAPPTTPGNPFGIGPSMMPLDPAAMSARIREEIERCQGMENVVDVHEKAGCQTLDAMLKVGIGQQDVGLATFREAATALADAGDHFGAAMTHFIMAETAKQVSRNAEAVTAYENAISSLEKLRETNAPIVLKSFAFFGRLGGMPEGFVEQAGPMMQMMGPMLTNQMEIMMRVTLASFLITQGRHDEADPHLQAALPLSRTLFGLMDGQILGLLAQVREHQGRLDEARTFYQEAIDAARQSGDEAGRQKLQERLDGMTPQSEPVPEPSPPEEPEDPAPMPAGDEPSPAPWPTLSQGGGRAGILDIDLDLLEARFRQDAERCQSSRDPPTVAQCQLIEGLLKVGSGRLADGFADLQASLQTLEDLGDRVGTILVRMALGDARAQAQQNEEALSVYRKALADVEALASSQEPIEVGIFSMFLQWAGLSGVPTPSNPSSARGRAILVALLELTVRHETAMVLAAQNRLKEAEEELRKAARLADSFFGLMDSQVYDHYAQVAALQGHFEEARRHYTRALEKTGLLGEMSLRLNILRRLTELERVTGQAAEAQRYSQMALDLARRRSDRRNEALILVDQVNIATDRGLMAEARSASEQALTAAAASGDFLAKAFAQLAAALVATSAGDYDDSLLHFERLSSILDEADTDLPHIAYMKVVTLTLTGNTYSLLGKPDRMAQKAADARRLAEKTGNPMGLTWSAFMQEFVRSQEGRTDELGQRVKDLLGIMNRSDGLLVRKISDESSFMTILTDVFRLDDEGAAKARTWLENPDAPKSPWERAAAVMALVMNLGSNGRHAEAVEILGKLRERAQEWSSPDIEALTTAMLAMIHLASGHSQEALESARRAVDLFEGLAGSIQVDELLASLFAKRRQNFYQLTVLLMATQAREEEAFLMAERARARALLHMLGNQRFDLRPGANRELLTELDELRSAILELERNPSASELLREKRQAYEEVLIRIKLTHPETRALLSVEPLDLATLREVLPPETTLVSYFMVPGSVLAWVVDRDNLTQFRFPLAQSDTQELVCLADRLGRSPARAVRPRAGCNGQDGLSEKYYSKLVAPLLSYIHHQQLIIVPHEALHYVPFAALRDPKSGLYLLETMTIAYIPSVNALRFLAEKTSPFDRDVLVMGDPETDLEELPWACDEAQTVAELFGTQPLVGADASESRIRASTGKIDLLHLAAHGVYSPRAPRFSHIALTAGDGNDGRLEVEEVFSSLDLRGVNLVTLSACQTALGERTDGDEIIGLTRGFLYAGSPAIVSSLWWVDDQATAFLMETFYEQLLLGEPYGDALRTAQMMTSKRPGWSDPYYWAAFTLTGSPVERWEP